MAQQAVRPRLSLLQQDRSRKTRKRLIAAADRLWRDRGFDDTAVMDVSHAAGVSKATFFYYFPRKEDLLVELALASAEHVWEEWEQLADRDLGTQETLKVIVLAIARRSQRTPRILLARTIVELLGLAGQWQAVRGDRPDFHKLFSAIFAKGKRKGDIPRGHDIDELASILTLTLLQGMLYWARHDNAEALDTILWRRTDMLLKGFLARGSSR